MTVAALPDSFFYFNDAENNRANFAAIESRYPAVAGAATLADFVRAYQAQLGRPLGPNDKNAAFQHTVVSAYLAQPAIRAAYPGAASPWTDAAVANEKSWHEAQILGEQMAAAQRKKGGGGLGGLVGGLVGFALGGPVGAAIGAGGGALAETGDLGKSLAAAGLAFGGGQLAGSLGGAGQAAVAAETAALTGSGVAVGGALGTGATAGLVTASGLQTALQVGQQAVKVASYFNQATGQRIDVAPNAPVPQGFRLIEVRDSTVQNVTDTAAAQGAAPAAPQGAAAAGAGMDPRMQLAIAAGLVLLIFFAFRKKG